MNTRPTIQVDDLVLRYRYTDLRDRRVYEVMPPCCGGDISAVLKIPNGRKDEGYSGLEIEYSAYWEWGEEPQ